MRRVLPSILAIFCLFASLGAAPGPKNSKSQAQVTPQKSPKPYQVGKASWYGKKFHGKLTASGESYDMFQFTAAHRQLPLGTWVKVTNLRNKRWVVVRINDRGPVPQGRIMDLSYGSAQMLGLNGVERVRLDVVQQPQTIIAMAQNLPGAP